MKSVPISSHVFVSRVHRRTPSLNRYQEHRCFVCGKHNPIGLHLEFDFKDNLTRTEFVPQPDHQGYDGVVHGGILASVLDDAMANCLWMRGITAVTAKMSLRYREPVPVGSRLRVYGRIVQERDKTATAEGWLTNAAGTTLVEASGTFFKLPATADDRLA